MSTTFTRWVAVAVIAFSSSCHNPASNVPDKMTINETTFIPPPAGSDSSAGIALPAMNALFISSATQHFKVSHKAISEVRGVQGLRVKVNPGAMVKADNTPITEPIEVNLIELTKPEDFFKSNATTISNGRLLMSGGSYFISMKSGGVALQVQKGKTLSVDFPRLKNNEMELFYGERRGVGDINWIPSDKPLLNIEEDVISYQLPYPDLEDPMAHLKSYSFYDSIGAKVKFMGKETKIKDMVQQLNKRGIDKVIDTVHLNIYDFRLRGYNWNCNNYSGFNWTKYRIISCADLEREKDTLAKYKKINGWKNIANDRYNNEWAQKQYKNSIAGQLQEYYAPAEITQLGWINCDRFYNKPLNTEVELELPYTINTKEIQYFVIYRSFNGLISGTLERNDAGKYFLKNLPEGEKVTLVTFVRGKEGVWESKTDFQIQHNKSVALSFSILSNEEFKNRFGFHANS